MAHVEESNGGKRDIAVELNLVPFIDLMSVCIIFLLITAVWTQVSMIQLGSSVYAKKTSENFLKNPSAHADIPFRVNVLENGFNVLIGRDRVVIPLKNKKYNAEALLKYIQKVKSRFPDKKDAIVASRDRVKYEHLVTALDVLLIAGFPEVAIATGEM